MSAQVREISQGNHHRFGGAWTADKLQVLRDYLTFYTQALTNKQFWLVYIDSFAGTGRCQIRAGVHGERLIDGSAKIALDCAPAFHRYHFIENNKKHAPALVELIGGLAGIQDFFARN